MLLVRAIPNAADLRGLVESFEDGTIDNCNFSHPEHIFVIWSLVRSRGTLPAVAQFETCLRRITEAEGHPEKYHATVTHALGIAVGERVAAAPELEWSEFAAANSDLFEWPNSTLASLYPNGELDTDEARSQFVLPHSPADSPAVSPAATE